MTTEISEDFGHSDSRLTDLDRVVAQTRLMLSVFESPLAGTVTAILSPSLEDASWLYGRLNGEVISATDLYNHLTENAGERFPVGYGATATDALRCLNDVLSIVTDAPGDLSRWESDVHAAYQSMRKAEDKNPWFISMAFESGLLHQVR